MLHFFRIALIVAAAVSLLGQRPAAQTLAFSLFERYLDSLREQSGIPGLSAAIVQGRRVVWDRGFGLASVEGSVPAFADTPYLLGDLSQTIGATLVLQQCMDRGSMEPSDRVVRWAPEFPDASATIFQLLAHIPPGGGFRYDPGRFGALTTVAAQCGNLPYRKLVALEVFDRLGMANSVPGLDVAEMPPSERRHFTADALERYTAVLRRLAPTYRGGVRPVRTDYPTPVLNAATGLISSARDLARFDAALDDGVLLEADTLALTRNTTVAGHPMGAGWFVQIYNNVRVVWQFGHVREGASALVLKVPERDLTFIALANSDGLAAPYALEQGDINTSVIARLFLRTFVP